MSKILISGYYGFNNIGDEAILEALINNVRHNIPEAEITVLSASPSVTSDRYNVMSVDRRSILKIIRHIIRCELLIVGGGSLLQDVTSKRSIYYYLVIIILGLMMKKKIMMYSQGIGPINKNFNRNLTGYLLNKVSFITVRDRNSKLELIKMGVNDSKIEVTADPVISLKKGNKELGLQILRKYNNTFDEKRPTIGFAFRDWKDNEGIRDVLVKTAETLSKDLEANIVFLPFHYDSDIKIMNDIEEKLNNTAVLIKGKHDIREMLSIMENLDLLVGVRLHSLIFSSVANVPIIAISYDPKVDYFMEDLGLEPFCNINELESESLISHIKDTWSHKDIYFESYNENLEIIKNRLKINDRIIKELVN